MFHESKVTTNVDLQIFTDSSSSAGFGEYNKKSGQFFRWYMDKSPTPGH